VSCIQSADRLSVKSRHWVVVGRPRPTTVRCIVRRQVCGAVAGGRRRACRNPFGHVVAERWVVVLRLRSGRILGSELHQIAVAGPRPSRACRPCLGGQIGETGEMGGSSVAGTSSALFGFEQAVGIHFSLERRHERRPGSPCRLARVVGGVESMCTDPATKGPTGPFCLVHLRMRPSFRCLPGIRRAWWHLAPPPA
jgi:hypothetical protein